MPAEFFLLNKMFKSKIACNATNSAGIDDNGNLQVWGSGRYGITGEGMFKRDS